MLIDKTEIERVKQATDLASFIRARGVKLTRKGKQMVGLCPFCQRSFTREPIRSSKTEPYLASFSVERMLTLITARATDAHLKVSHLQHL